MGWLKKILSVEQDSLPGFFNWKDAVHVARIAAVGALAIAGVTFLHDVDKFDYGLLDALIHDAVLSAIVAVEAWKADNS